MAFLLVKNMLKNSKENTAIHQFQVQVPKITIVQKKLETEPH